MGRIREYIVINGNNRWTLFDSGSRNNYIIQSVTEGLPSFSYDKPEKVHLAGKVHKIANYCNINCRIQGNEVVGLARVIDILGKDETGKEIEILIGALTMQEWGIRLNLTEENLDLSHYSNDFLEF